MSTCAHPKFKGINVIRSQVKGHIYELCLSNSDMASCQITNVFQVRTKFLNSFVFASFTDIHTSHSMIRLGRKKYFLNRREFYCIADQLKEYGKSSVSRLVRIQSFVEFPFYAPICFVISCLNDLFFIEKPATNLNPSTGEVRYLPQ